MFRPRVCHAPELQQRTEHVQWMYCALIVILIIHNSSIITSPLNPVNFLEAEVSATAAAQAAESRKHHANDPKCSDLGWVCVPMVVETYGTWGKEATAIISSLAPRLTTSMCRPKSIELNEIYGRLNLHLVWANATAILSRIAPCSVELYFLYLISVFFCIFMLFKNNPEIIKLFIFSLYVV